MSYREVAAIAVPYSPIRESQIVDRTVAYDGYSPNSSKPALYL